MKGSLIECQGDGTRQGSSVGGVLLIAPLEVHGPDVKRKSSDDQERDRGASKQDEDLSPLS